MVMAIVMAREIFELVTVFGAIYFCQSISHAFPSLRRQGPVVDALR